MHSFKFRFRARSHSVPVFDDNHSGDIEIIIKNCIYSQFVPPPLSPPYPAPAGYPDETYVDLVADLSKPFAYPIYTGFNLVDQQCSLGLV